MLLAQSEGVEFGAGEKFGWRDWTRRGEVGREEQGADAVEWERIVGPAQDVERGSDHGRVGERNAERELVGTGRGGRGDVFELRREDGPEDSVDLGAVRFDVRDDDGDAGVRLAGEAGAQPAGAGGEFGVFVGRVGECAVSRGWRLAEVVEAAATGADGVEQGGLSRRFGVEADQQEFGSDCEAAVGEGGAKGFGKLGLSEVAGASAAALELAGPAGKGGCVGVAWEG